MSEQFLQPVDDERDDDDGFIDVTLIAKEDEGPSTPSIAAGQAKTDDEDSPWGEEPILTPTADPDGTHFWYRNAPSLRPNIDAIAQNVDGFGWKPEPTIDFEAEDLRQQIATALYLDRYTKWEDGGETGDEPGYPSEDEITTAEKEWREAAQLEKARLEQHFKAACYESSFVDLRKQTTVDKEVNGYAAWEVIRARANEGPPRRYIRVDGNTIRYLRASTIVDTKVPHWTSANAFRMVSVKQRLHLLVQVDGSDNAKRHFKPFGDLRIISSATGKEYKTLVELVNTENPLDDPPTEEQRRELEITLSANELLIFTIYFPRSKYGAPRWFALGPEVKGQWLAANHNVDYLENSAIPRSMLLTDGKVGSDSVAMIRKYLTTQKGKAQHRMMIVQAQKPRDRAYGDSGALKLEYVDLSSSQREDMMFDRYDKRVDAKVGMAFRIPRVLRGDTEDINRATSENALRSTENQVFAPDRNSFDWVMNNKILPELKVRFWRFKSLGPSNQDPVALTEILEKMLKTGVVVPAEVRPLAERILGIDLLRVAGDWQQLPLPLVMQGFKPPSQKPALSEGETEGDDAGADESTLPEPPPGQEPPQADVLKEAAAAVEELREMFGDEMVDKLVDGYKRAIETDRAASDLYNPPE